MTSSPTILDIQIPQASMMKKVFACFETLLTNVNLQFNKEGMQINAMDETHSILVWLQIGTELFEKYNCSKPTTLGINVPGMLNVLKLAKKNDFMQLKYNENGDNVDIILKNNENSRIVRFKMKLMDIIQDNYDLTNTKKIVNRPLTSNKKQKNQPRLKICFLVLTIKMRLNYAVRNLKKLFKIYPKYQALYEFKYKTIVGVSWWTKKNILVQ